MLAQSAFNLTQFNAEAANLHLMVGATEEVDGSIGTETDHISRAVESWGGFAREGILNEALVGSAG